MPTAEDVKARIEASIPGATADVQSPDNEQYRGRTVGDIARDACDGAAQRCDGRRQAIRVHVLREADIGPARSNRADRIR